MCRWKVTEGFSRSHAPNQASSGSQRPLLQNQKLWQLRHHCHAQGKLGKARVLLQRQSVRSSSQAELVTCSATMPQPRKIVGRSAIEVAFSEGARNWPFVFGFAFTLGLVTWVSSKLDRESYLLSIPQLLPCSERLALILSHDIVSDALTNTRFFFATCDFIISSSVVSVKASFHRVSWFLSPVRHSSTCMWTVLCTNLHFSATGS